MDSLPPAEAKLVNIAPAAILPQSSSVAIDPAALLSAAAMQNATGTAPSSVIVPSSTVAVTAAALKPPEAASQPHQPGGQIVDDAAGSDRENVANVLPNGGSEHQNGHMEMASADLEADSLTKLPQLGLTLSPTKVLPHVPSKSTPKVATPKSARSGTPRGGRGLKGRPPRSASNLGRQDSSFTATDSGKGRTLLHRTSTD